MEELPPKMPTSLEEIPETALFEQLKDLLLREDRIAIEALNNKLDDSQQLDSKVGPIIERYLDLLKTEFPDSYYKVVDNMIQARLTTSQGEILDTIYPAVGRMIRKYVQLQFSLLRQELADQAYRTFNTGFIGRIKYALFGMSKRDELRMLAMTKIAKVIEVFVIEQHSGILLGSASRKESVDRDLIAGMLTAIKSFVEDAFNRGDTDLEKISYDDHSIHISNFFTCYIAVVVNGRLTAEEEEYLEQRTTFFAQSSLLKILRQNPDNQNLQMKVKLERAFFFSNKPAPKE